MKFIKKPNYRLELGDDYWINRAAEEVTGVSQSDAESSIDLPDLQTAIEVAELILRKYAEFKPLVDIGDAPGLKFSSRQNLDKAFIEIGGLGALQRDGVKALFDCQFVGGSRCTYNVSGDVVLRREVEIRVGRNVKTSKTIVFEGEEYTRKVFEKKWSRWYPGDEEIVSIHIRVCHLVTPDT
jgi:hypothetical protein